MRVHVQGDGKLLEYDCPCGEHTKVLLTDADVDEVLDRGVIHCIECARWSFVIKTKQWIQTVWSHKIGHERTVYGDAIVPPCSPSCSVARDSAKMLGVDISLYTKTELMREIQRQTAGYFVLATVAAQQRMVLDKAAAVPRWVQWLFAWRRR